MNSSNYDVSTSYGLTPMAIIFLVLAVIVVVVGVIVLVFVIKKGKTNKNSNENLDTIASELNDISTTDENNYTNNNDLYNDQSLDQGYVAPLFDEQQQPVQDIWAQPIMNQGPIMNEPMQPMMEQTPVMGEPVQPMMEQAPIMSEPVQPIMEQAPIMNEPVQPIMEQAPMMGEPVQPIEPIGQPVVQEEVTNPENIIHTSLWSNNTDNGQM